MKKYKYLDKPLLFLTIALLVFGLIMVFSASNVTAYMTYNKIPYYYFIKQLIFVLLGIIGFFIITNMNTKSLGAFSYILIFVFGSLLVYLLVSNKVTAQNNALSWISIGPINIQPSEFIKVVTIFWLAYYYERHVKSLDNWTVVLFPMFICGVIALLIILQPDLGTAIIYTVIVGAIFFSVPLSKKIKFIMRTMLVSIFVLIFLLVSTGGINKILNDRQSSRITGFKDPCSNLLTTGNQVCNAYIAINNGGIDGVGLGKSTQKYLYLPEAYTDFIFAIIVEELGLVTGILLLILYMVLLYRILKIGRASPNNRGATICYGTATYIFIHIVVNLMGILGMMPMTGVPLPFMSYGGSFMICLIASIAAVQRVSIENHKYKNKRA